MKLSEHFDIEEFACKCSKHCKANPDKELIDKLEKLHNLLNAKSIIITSGYRCPEHSSSLEVGGTINDGHTRNIAADIIAYKQDNTQYDAETIAEAAEKVGFTGIGIITAYAVHVDVRNKQNYINDHWFGNEMTGNDYITTFNRGTVFVPRETQAKNKMKVTIEFDDHKYSGLLEED